MAELFNTTKQNISLHLLNIFKDKELNENLVVKEFLTTAEDSRCLMKFGLVDPFFP